MKVEFGLTDAASYPAATLARIRANLNIDAVVLGSFLHLEGANGNRIRLDVRLQDARSGQSIASIADNGDEANLVELVIRCGARLRARLGVGAASEAATKSFRAKLFRRTNARSGCMLKPSRSSAGSSRWPPGIF